MSWAVSTRAGVTLCTYAKQGFRTSRAAYIVGNSESGMSQTNFPLFPYPRGNRAVGRFRVLSPGAASDIAGATTGAFTSVAVGNQTTACRWLPATRLHMFGANRSVFVTQERGAMSTAASTIPPEAGLPRTGARRRLR